MPQTQLSDLKTFFHNNAKVSSSSPPEEIIAVITGGCGLWQIAVVSVGLISQFISGLEQLSIKVSLPSELNFTCADGNDSQCVTANGNKCTNFVFFKHSDNVVISFTETLKLVCELGNYPEWLKDCYRFGLAIGFFLAGALSDKLGHKVTAMIFIPLQCLTGTLIIRVKNVVMLFIYVLTHGIVSMAIIVVSVLTVCDAVGNNWRTFALGLLYVPKSISIMIFPYYYHIFSNSEEVIATISIIPLILLIPLAHFNDSPNYICLVSEFEKSEKALHKISKCSRSPVPPTTRLRPVQIVVSSNIPKRAMFLKIFEPVKVKKAFLALIIFWFFMGCTNSTLTYYAYKEISHFAIFGLCGLVGCLTSLALCHWVSHKMVIGIMEVLKCLSIAGLYFYDIYFENTMSIPFIIIKMFCGLFQVASMTVAIIITPRMFPTELRGGCFGLCGSVYQFGFFLEKIIRQSSKISIYVVGLILTISPIFEACACFYFWDVHKRELPDFLIDCIRFRTYYKPTRFIIIYNSEQQDEIEIQFLDFSELDK